MQLGEKAKLAMTPDYGSAAVASTAQSELMTFSGSMLVPSQWRMACGPSCTEVHGECFIGMAPAVLAA